MSEVIIDPEYAKEIELEERKQAAREALRPKIIEHINYIYVLAHGKKTPATPLEQSEMQERDRALAVVMYALEHDTFEDLEVRRAVKQFETAEQAIWDATSKRIGKLMERTKDIFNRSITDNKLIEEIVAENPNPADAPTFARAVGIVGPQALEKFRALAYEKPLRIKCAYPYEYPEEKGGMAIEIEITPRYQKGVFIVKDIKIMREVNLTRRRKNKEETATLQTIQQDFGLTIGGSFPVETVRAREV